jgi:hypothetical protein
MYEAIYDDYADLGGTTVRRCKNAPGTSNLLESAWHHFQCDDGELVESCGLGRHSRVPKSLASSIRSQLLAATPGRLSPILAPLQLGAPASSWNTESVRSAVAWVESGGIVSVGIELTSSSFVKTITLAFAGPCSSVTRALETKWGVSTMNTWTDRALKQQARFDPAGCSLRIERTLD